MAMRTECRFFESRSYPTGDTVQKCDLDLAPEAPWRCPDGCVRFTRRLADVGWNHGSLVVTPPPAEPPGLGDGSAAAVLDEAEDIINSIGFTVMAEVERDKAQQRKGLRRFFRRGDR